MNSPSITCSVDGVLVTRTTDDTNCTATRHGLAAFQSPLARFDDFQVDELPVQPNLLAAPSGHRSVELGNPVAFSATVVNAGSAPTREQRAPR